MERQDEADARTEVQTVREEVKQARKGHPAELARLQKAHDAETLTRAAASDARLIKRLEDELAKAQQTTLPTQ